MPQIPLFLQRRRKTGPFRSQLSGYGVLIIVGLFFIGCTTTSPNNFAKVHLGMDKSRIVETVGSPTIERRWQGRDRWIYELHDNDDVTVKEVHFQNGIAIYIGPPPKPTVTADEQDKINAADAAQDDKRMNAETVRHEQAIGASRPRTPKEPEDAIDRKLRESMYGIEPDPANERNVYVPQFEPVR